MSDVRKVTCPNCNQTHCIEELPGEHIKPRLRESVLLEAARNACGVLIEPPYDSDDKLDAIDRLVAAVRNYSPPEKSVGEEPSESVPVGIGPKVSATIQQVEATTHQILQTRAEQLQAAIDRFNEWYQDVGSVLQSDVFLNWTPENVRNLLHRVFCDAYLLGNNDDR